MAVTSSVFLNVQNIEKSLEFYRNLGFRVAKTYKADDGKVTYADLSLQGAEFGLGHIPSSDDPAFRQWVSTPLGAGVIIYFTVPNADRYYSLAQAAKADIEMPITDRPYGRMFMLNDPDGYTLSFISETRPRKAAKPVKRAAKTVKKAAKGVRAKVAKVAKKATKARRK